LFILIDKKEYRNILFFFAQFLNKTSYKYIYTYEIVFKSFENIRNMIRINKNQLNTFLLRLNNTQLINPYSKHFIFKFSKVETNESTLVYLYDNSTIPNIYNLFQLNESVNNVQLTAGEYYFNVYDVNEYTTELPENSTSLYFGFADVKENESTIEVIDFNDGTENNNDTVINFE